LVSLPAARVVVCFRRRAGISQERLAAEASVDRTEVGRIERHGKDARLSTVNALLVALGRTWSEFGAALNVELSADTRRS